MMIHRIAHEFPNFTLDIENVSLGERQIIGIVGENGSGKTTLMSVLAGFLKANRAFDVVDYELDNMMFLPSDVGLYDLLSVGDFVQIVVANATTSLDPRVILDRLQLTDKKDEKIMNLSEGMRKKLTLIVLFTQEYKYLLLDEPFNSIDVHYVHDLKKQIRTIGKTSTVLISSHILDTLNDLCDSFIYIKNGLVVKQFVNDKGNILERELFEADYLDKTHIMEV